MAGGARDGAHEFRRGLVAGILSMLWMAPCAQFWLAVWGPLRPYGYPEGSLGPSGAVFLGGIAAAALPVWLPPGYFRPRPFERGGGVYEALGVRIFRWFVPDGDLVNARVRRRDPAFRVVRGRAGARAFLARTEQGERSHLVLLVFGAVSSAYAWRIGWHGWAALLTVGNVAVNLYPVLLQRYTRARILGLLSRGSGRLD